MARKNPEWLTYDAEGNAHVTLVKGLNLSGCRVTAVKLREPTVADQRTAALAAKGDDAVEEIGMLANLADVTPADIEGATLRDYNRLQVALLGFIN